MKVYELLKRDHRKVEDLFEQILDTTIEDVDERESLFRELRMNLEAHSKAEEALFYPTLEESEDAKDLAFEAYEEHDVVKNLLEEIEGVDVTDERWHAKVKVLSEIVKHHVKEEESQIFKQAKKILDSQQEEQLASMIEEDEEEEKQRVFAS